MSLRQIEDTEAELHQPPTPTFHVESSTRFRLIAPHYLDMAFRCVPHEPLFSRGYLAFVWASYMNAPKEYSFRIRTVLRPRCSRDELLTEFEQWNLAK